MTVMSLWRMRLYYYNIIVYALKSIELLIVMYENDSIK